MGIGDIWNLVFLSPMINVLVVMSQYLLNNFGLSIIAFTILVRLLTLPLTMKQLKATKAVQTLQPKLMELQKKFARDRQKLAQEQMRLYRESGVSPVGCMVPMLVQLPVWIALYQSIIKVLAVVPEDFLSLSQHLYSSWSAVFSLVPLASRFLWLDLAKPDNFLVFPILVGGTMWVQQKMVTPPLADPRLQSQNRMMLWMMPLMFAFFTLSFPSGLALYWVVSNIISIVIQYYMTGWGGLAPAAAGGPGGKGGKTYVKRISRVEQKSSADVPASTGAGVPPAGKESGLSTLRKRLGGGK
ncbi:MAG: membrane protein insertase YidC [Chloroflexi bacterium]|nr:membrane protein insertase YidC [Chloroflexota bacterium]